MSKQQKSFFSEEASTPTKSASKKEKGTTLSASKSGRTWGLVIGLILIGGFVALIAMDLGGLFSTFGFYKKQTITDTTYHIGYYKLSLYTFNDTTMEYELTEGTFALTNYYTEEWIANVTADGTTIYQTTNVTMATLISVANGKTYPNKTVTLFTNTTSSGAYDNSFFLDYVGDASDLSMSIVALDNVYGSYTLASVTNANFTITIQSINTNNGTFGEQFYLPLPFMNNENVSIGGLFMKINKEETQVLIDGFDSAMYLDGAGNTYVMYPKINKLETRTHTVQFVGGEIPTQIDFIQGQIDDIIVESLT